MEGAPGTLYEGEKFQLLFKFSSRYPFDSPQVSSYISESVCVYVGNRGVYLPPVCSHRRVQAASLDTNKQTGLESGSV